MARDRNKLVYGDLRVFAKQLEDMPKDVDKAVKKMLREQGTNCVEKQYNELVQRSIVRLCIAKSILVRQAPIIRVLSAAKSF
ncbi:hypothetical protein DXA94_10050 [Agathobaculum butyriciproducens]|nr:hypothetical protein DXA94_10050 [Agathobaculum butyriciproducens]